MLNTWAQLLIKVDFKNDVPSANSSVKEAQKNLFSKFTTV